MSSEFPTPTGPLAGLKVIELGQIMAGPTCGLVLAGMGATIYKIEKIPEGDDGRSFRPPEIAGESAGFMTLNANKRSLALDLKHPEGKAVLRRMLAECDVVIENFRRGTLERLGFSYAAMQALNPGLILCSISGFGRTGPYADKGGFDLIAQGMSGIMSVNGEGPGRPPIKCGVPVADLGSGILAATGILAALYRRKTDGRGQIVDTSLFETGIFFTTWPSSIYAATGEDAVPQGSAHFMSAPYQAFEAADGWFNLGGSNQRTWLGILRAFGLEALGADPRFLENKQRMENLPALVAELAPVFRRLPVADIVARLEAEGVPAGPINRISQVHTDPQTIARQMVVEVPHTTGGLVKTIGVPVKFSATPGGIVHGAPLLGEHTAEILGEFGYTPDEIAALHATGAIAFHDDPALAAAAADAKH
jgi:crotonobetainyl-CoA:carnitine CoA-transferase CaiB-like acyl-CoA transferase